MLRFITMLEHGALHLTDFLHLYAILTDSYRECIYVVAHNASGSFAVCALFIYQLLFQPIASSCTGK